MPYNIDDNNNNHKKSNNKNNCNADHQIMKANDTTNNINNRNNSGDNAVVKISQDMEQVQPTAAIDDDEEHNNNENRIFLNVRTTIPIPPVPTATATATATMNSNSKINAAALGGKSNENYRPVLNIPHRGIGPITEPNENDVLCGRSGCIHNSHTGNVKFRNIIQSKKKEYLSLSTKKLKKSHIAADIVHDIRTMDPPGRFLLKEDDNNRGSTVTELWFDIGAANAIKKNWTSTP
jgi:hypothetical protein